MYACWELFKNKNKLTKPVSFESQLSTTIDILEDALYGITIEKCIVNPSVRKLYEISGPIEVLIAGFDCFLLSQTDALNKSQLLSGDSYSIETWAEVVLVGSTLFAGFLDLTKQLIWPTLYRLGLTSTETLFIRGSFFDKLYQIIGRVEGITAILTLVLFYTNTQDDEDETIWEEIESWVLPILSGLSIFIALIDIIMNLIACYRNYYSLRLPNNVLKSWVECLDIQCLSNNFASQIEEYGLANSIELNTFEVLIKMYSSEMDEDLLSELNIRNMMLYRDAEKILSYLKRVQATYITKCQKQDSLQQLLPPCLRVTL